MSQRSKVKFTESQFRARSVDEEQKQPDIDDDKLNKSLDSVKSKRGRPAIPDQWTGIIRVEEEDVQVELKIRQLGADLILEDAMPTAPRSLRSKDEWKMLFDPKEFWQEHNFLTLEMAELTLPRLT